MFLMKKCLDKLWASIKRRYSNVNNPVLSLVVFHMMREPKGMGEELEEP
jgi:hypothetical protein